MSDKDTTKNTPTSTPKKPLTLSKKLSIEDIVDHTARNQKRPGSGHKTVVVEVKRGRSHSPDQKSVGLKTKSSNFAPLKKPETASSSSVSQVSSDKTSDNLTNLEREARIKALQGASQFVAQEVQRGEARLKEEAELVREKQKRQEEELKQRLEEAAKKNAQPQEEPIVEPVSTEVVSPKVETAPVSDPYKIQKSSKKDYNHGDSFDEDDDTSGRETNDRKKAKRAPEVRRTPISSLENKRRSGKISITQALSGDEGRVRSLASIRRSREKERLKAMTDGTFKKVVREVSIPEAITVQELASRMAEKSSTVIKTLMKMGTMATITQSIDGDTAQLVAEELGHTVKRITDVDMEANLLNDTQDDLSTLVSRPPVVTVMGHVDHGKTSLLDALRSTDVASGEAGGITQHIGAYQVTMKNGKKITFIDTPGHAAFTEMRARGANVTDLVVLVVAADDSVKDQTVEAISHARAAGVPVIIAINKIDKPEANVAKVKNDLLSHSIVLEEMGGDILSTEVSAKARLNLDKLEETILLQAEIMDLKANPKRDALGTIIESRMEKGCGPVATVLVQKGTLKVGDIFVAGHEWGRVRALVNDHGRKVEMASPAQPVEVLGFNGLPLAGDIFSVVKDEAKAREISGFREMRFREKQAAVQEKDKMANLFSNAQMGLQKTLCVVIKADAQGSAEAIKANLEKLSTEEVSLRVLYAGAGGINESDIALSQTTKALVIGFNVRANAQARALAQKEKTDIRYYSIIYNVFDDVKALLTGLLSPILQEKFLGKAEIRQVFNVTKVGKIAGCMVTEGRVKRGTKLRLLRDNVVIHEGDLKTLKHFKDEVKEVKEGSECGMAFENYQDIRVGDIIECSEIEEIARTAL